jgi:nitroimidazol reductase NimA-like FMN-containing flavoprotein (pyridoxamine 5'-phosphate oxidase superfamily)
MSDGPRTQPPGPPAGGGGGEAGGGGGEAGGPAMEELSEQDCLRLAAGQEIGRIAFVGRFGLTVFPVNYRLWDDTVVFRTGQRSALDEDLRTGIAQAEYQVAFEIDEVDRHTREGWSVLIQGHAHHVTSEAERAEAAQAGVTPWPGGAKELFIRVVPTRITGRRIRQPGG